MRSGRIVKLTACSAFKVALVLGPSRAAGKLRVVTYSHNKRKWSKPHPVREADCVDPIFATMKPGQRRTVVHALQDGAGMGAWARTT